jgi:hypothetical protein
MLPVCNPCCGFGIQAELIENSCRIVRYEEHLDVDIEEAVDMGTAHEILLVYEISFIFAISREFYSESEHCG